MVWPPDSNIFHKEQSLRSIYFNNDNILHDLLLRWNMYNPGHNILELYNFLVQVQFATSKTNLLSIVTNLAYKLPHELLNNSRLNILAISEILEKS